MMSCSNTQGTPVSGKGSEVSKGNTTIIDGHEYIQVENSLRGFQDYSYSITHKGDCNLCESRRKKTDSLIMELLNRK